MQLWVHWTRCEATLQQLQDEARSHGRPFVVHGLRKLLTLAGVVGRRATIALGVAPPEMPMPAGLPSDTAMLRSIVRRLLSQQRVLRARIVVLEGEVRYAADRVTHYRQEAANLRRQIRQMPNRVAQVHDELFSEAAPRHTSISQKEVVLLEWRRLSALALTRHRSVLADAATSVDPCAVPQCAIGPESASQLFPTELRQDSSRSMAAQCHTIR